jgi:hypothetical protein
MYAPGARQSTRTGWMADHSGDIPEDIIDSDSRRRHRDEQESRELKRLGEGQRDRGSSLRMLLDAGRVSQLMTETSDGRTIVDVSALLCSIDASPTWFEQRGAGGPEHEMITIPSAAKMIGMDPNALRLRVWRARKRGEYTPFSHAGPSQTFLASKSEFMEWRNTWVGKRKARTSARGDVTRPA